MQISYQNDVMLEYYLWWSWLLWLAGCWLYCIFRKPSYFSCYAAKFLVEVYELCSIIISTYKDLCSIFIHDHVQEIHMSIWIMKVYEHKKMRSFHLEVVMRSLHLKVVIRRLWDPSTLETCGQMRSLYFEGLWSDEISQFWRHMARRDPFNLEAHG